MSENQGVDECGWGSRRLFQPIEISEKEIESEWVKIDFDDLDHWEDLNDSNRLFLLASLKKDVLEILQEAYRVSFRMFAREGFGNEMKVLIELRRLLCCLMAEMRVMKNILSP